MSTLRRIAEIPTGSWTKWLVVGFWVAVLAVAYPLSGKLKGAEKNNTAQWVPAAPASAAPWPGSLISASTLLNGRSTGRMTEASPPGIVANP